MLSVSVSN
jgi:hypothetical protein